MNPAGTFGTRAARVAIFISGALLLGAGRGQLRPEPEPRPAKGVFLVAKPDIGGGPFLKSVVLLLEHDQSGTLGVIINRATEIPLAEAMPELDAAESRDLSLFFGGPVGLDGLLFLFRAEDPPEGAREILESLYFSGDAQVLENQLAASPSGDSLRLYLGHAGWAPGQLDEEIERGSWKLVPANVRTVFDAEPQAIWKDLYDGDRRTIAAE